MMRVVALIIALMPALTFAIDLSLDQYYEFVNQFYLEDPNLDYYSLMSYQYLDFDREHQRICESFPY